MRNLLLEVKEELPDRFDKLCKKVDTHFGLHLGRVDFDASKDLYVHANYQEKIQNSDVPFDIAYQGSGFLQILQLLTAIYRYCGESKVILLDEPDAHLHPNLQGQMANILREVGDEEKLQIILATHSASIIRAAMPEEVVPVSKTFKQGVPLEADDQVENAIASRLDNYTIAKAVISNKIIFTEDHKTDLLEALDGACGTKLFSGPNTTPVLRAEGKDDPMPFRIADVLQKMTGKSIVAHFIRDRDGLPDEWCEKICDYAKGKNITLHFWPFYEIENAVLSPQYLHNVCTSVESAENRSCPTSDDIERALTGRLKDLIAMGRYKYRDTLRDSISKIAKLVGDRTFSSTNEVEKEVDRIADRHERRDSYEELRTIGPGKEALGWFHEWL